MRGQTVGCQAECCCCEVSERNSMRWGERGKSSSLEVAPKIQHDDFNGDGEIRLGCWWMLAKIWTLTTSGYLHTKIVA